MSENESTATADEPTPATGLEAELREVLTLSTPEPEPSTDVGKPTPETPEVGSQPESTGEKQDDAPPVSDKTESHIPVKVVQEERAKRQALEAQVQVLTQQIQSFAPQPQAQVPEEIKIDPQEVYENPEKVTAALLQKINQMEQSFQTTRVQDRAKMSVDTIRGQKQDAKEAFQAFHQATQTNPALQEAFFASDNPGLYAYQQGQLLKLQQTVGNDPAVFVKTLKEQAIAEYVASQEASKAGKKVETPDTLTGLATGKTISTGGKSDPVSAGLHKIFPD